MQNNETTINISWDEEEWYGTEYTCDQCGGMFMTSSGDLGEYDERPSDMKVRFCPYCGRKIIGYNWRNETKFTFEENN